MKCRRTLSTSAAATLMTALVVCACEESRTDSVRTPMPQQVTTTPAETPSEAPSSTRASLPSLDLLRAVAANVVVSSVYRGDPLQAIHLADGSLETAWNSRSNELLQSWIEIQLPREVQVSSIDMTVGFTQQTEHADLFTGNQRIARVRVLHEGSPAVEFSFDVDSRALQSIPVSGGGGSYRLEILELRAGTHSNWAEVCISELRVMGSAENANAGQRFPHFYVGSAPELNPTPPASLEQRTSAFIAAQASFAEAWSHFEHARHRDQNETGEPGIEHADAVTFARSRTQILNRLAAAIEANAPEQGDAIRLLAAQEVAPTDLSSVSGALVAAAVGLPAAASCAWTESHIGVLLSRVADGVALQRELDDMDDAMGGGASGPDLGSLEGRMQDLQWSYRGNARTTIHTLQRVRMPHVARTQADWSTLMSLIDQNATLCGWSSPT